MKKAGGVWDYVSKPFVEKQTFIQFRWHFSEANRQTASNWAEKM